MSLYLILDIVAVTIPLLLSFEKHLKFYQRWKYIFPAILVMMVPFLIWDEYFTQMGFWSFNEAYISGVRIMHLPLEEILFFIVVPYASIFAYYSITTHFPWYRMGNRLAFNLTWLLIIAGMLIAIFNTGRPYTLINFLFFALVLVLVRFFRPSVLPKFLAIFPILLIPFFLMNGILTGTGIQDQVVWYSEEVYMGIRMWTIPLEDVFYAFSLIIGVLFVMEIFESGVESYREISN